MKPETIAGDTGFIGADLLTDPTKLSHGLLADAENIRYRNRVAEARFGVVKPAWANRADPATGAVRHWGDIHGYGVFDDPNLVEWQLVAADGDVYRFRQHNVGTSIPLPTGVRLLSRCKFVQAFSKVYLMRGRSVAPLRMANFDNGFEDLVQRWDSGTVYTGLAEVAFGPVVTVATLTSVASTVTAATSTAHGYVTGADVVIAGATQAEYNGRFNVTVVDSKTFTYQFGSSVTSPATTATAITCSNMAFYWKALGSVWTVTITRAGSTATATKTAHGFSNLDSVTITGAAQPEYNGTFVISNVTANTFDYPVTGVPATPATGTIKARDNSRVLVAQSPATNPEAWQQIFGVLPNCDDGVFVNNRLLAITAYTPVSASETFDASSAYTRSDFLVACDIGDEIHFKFFNAFRINQGSADELVELQKFGKDTLICMKGNSWGVLEGVTGDLSAMTLDMKGREYGLTSNGGSIVAGQNVYFMAARRGVIGLRETEQGLVQSLDIPLSRDIDPLIKRINWSLAAKIQMAYWDNKLYVAAPLDSNPPPIELVAPGSSYLNEPSFTYTLTGKLEIGRSYIYTPGVNDQELLVNGLSLMKQSEFVYRGGAAILYWIGPDPNSTGYSVTASVKEKQLAAGNNCILIYDFLTQKWTPRDTGFALTVKQFAKAIFNGVTRLFFVSEDGYVNLMEEAWDTDELADPSTARGIVGAGIKQRWRTRAYETENNRHGEPSKAMLVMQTADPSYSVNLLFDGVGESFPVDKDGVTVFTRNPVKYARPFDANDWDPSNVNDDHGTPYREDYAAKLDFFPGSGVALDVMQDTPELVTLGSQQGRSAQIEIVNTQGRLVLKLVELDVTTHEQTAGVEI